MRAWRVALIALFAVAVFLFGHRNSPLSPPAQATVFQSLGGGFAGVPNLWELQVDPGAVQTAELNGNRIHYTLQEDWRSVAQVLDYYEALYAGPAADFGGENPRDPDIEGVDWDALRQEMNEHVPNRALRLETSEWGIYGTVVLPDWNEPGFAEEIAARAELAAKTGKISDMGEAKFVYALRPRGASVTTVLAAWPSPDFNVFHMMPDGDEDAPGIDPPDVPRIGGDRRLLSFVQDRPEMTVYMAQYQSRAGVNEVLDFYSTQLPQYDWSEDTRVAVADAGSGAAPAALFVRGRQQCHVTVSEDSDSRTTVATVVVTGPPGSLD